MASGSPPLHPALVGQLRALEARAAAGAGDVAWRVTRLGSRGRGPPAEWADEVDVVPYRGQSELRQHAATVAFESWQPDLAPDALFPGGRGPATEAAADAVAEVLVGWDLEDDTSLWRLLDATLVGVSLPALPAPAATAATAPRRSQGMALTPAQRALADAAEPSAERALPCAPRRSSAAAGPAGAQGQLAARSQADPAAAPAAPPAGEVMDVDEDDASESALPRRAPAAAPPPAAPAGQELPLRESLHRKGRSNTEAAPAGDALRQVVASSVAGRTSASEPARRSEPAAPLGCVGAALALADAAAQRPGASAARSAPAARGAPTDCDLFGAGAAAAVSPAPSGAAAQQPEASRARSAAHAPAVPTTRSCAAAASPAPAGAAASQAGASSARLLRSAAALAPAVAATGTLPKPKKRLRQHADVPAKAEREAKKDAG